MPKRPTTRKTVPRKPKREEQSEHAAREERPDRSDQWEHRVRQIARETFQEMIQTMRTIPPVFPESPLPLPHRTGRKEDRKYTKMTITLDNVLAERLLSEAKKQRLSPGKILDSILWERYGRPRLTYQEERSEQDETK